MLESVIDTFLTHRALQVRRVATGTIVDGVYTQGAPSYFRIDASIRPDSGATLQNVQEGEHETETRALYTRSAELWPELRDVPGRAGHEADTVLLEGVPAFLALGGHTAHVNTVVSESIDGVDGNATTLALVAGAVGQAGVFDESAYPVLRFTFLSGSTTVADLEAAVAASSHARVKTRGTPTNVLVAVTDEVAPVALAGGYSETWRVTSTKRYRAHWKCMIERLDRP